MEYKYYNIENYILDDEFRDWVLHPHRTTIHSWDKISYNPLKNHCLNQARTIILNSQPTEYKIKKEVIESEFETIRNYYQKQTTQEANSKSSVFFRVLKVAAIAILFLLIGTLKQVNYNPEQLFYSSNSHRPKQIILPEGSNVILAKGAELTFNRNWRSDGERIARLKGKAYFSVKTRHYQGKKIHFRVHTPDLTVEVLGTEFNVNTEENLTQVVLNSGKVRLKTRQTNQQLIMNPGDVVEYFHNFKKLVVKSEIDHEKFISWTKPVFNNTSNKLASTSKGSEYTISKSKKDLPEFGTYYNYSIKQAVPNMPIFIRPNLPKLANNIVYQKQIGKNNSFRAVQYGEKNITTSISKGNENIAEIEQKGSNNKIDGANLHSLPEFGIVQFGNFNQLKIAQKGIFNQTQAHQFGDRNASEIYQLGADNKNITLQMGNENKAFVKQIGNNLTSSQIQIGNQNKAEVKFSGNNYRTQNDDANWSSYQEQVGDYNKSMLLIRNSSPNTNAYTLQHGQSNKINSELSEDNNYLFVIQQGYENVASSETSEGGFNEIYIYQAGEQNEIGDIWNKGIKQKGLLNDANIMQTGIKNKAITNQTGVNNQVQIQQSDKNK
jgi:hypothetical protein